MSSAPSSLALRAVLAITLLVGFYALALGLAGALLYVPYAEVTYGHRLHLKLLLLCVGGAGAILWSVVPRAARFEAPGPELDAASQPRLFALIREVADATKQPMPAEVYLMMEANAAVTHRGGIMGFGSRRVLFVGLPFLVADSISELRATLAHEFGHFHGGDTALGPWIYKTRAAIGRTLTNLGESMLRKPFEWYGKLFLRVTQAISRQQELAADALSLHVAGRRAAIGALRTEAAAALAFDKYVGDEVAPVLRAGYRPPIADGFGRFMRAPAVSAALGRFVERHERDAASDPYDSHPSLRERIAYLEGLVGGDDVPYDDRPAVTLLDETVALEARLLGERASQARPVDWAGVSSRVWPDIWASALGQGRLPEGATVGDLGALVAEAEALGRRAAEQQGAQVQDPEAARNHGCGLCSAALAVTLLRAGWSVSAPPGEPAVFSRGAHVLEPWRVVAALAGGELSADAWRARAEALGVAGLPLASGASDGSAS